MYYLLYKYNNKTHLHLTPCIAGFVSCLQQHKANREDRMTSQQTVSSPEAQTGNWRAINPHAGPAVVRTESLGFGAAARMNVRAESGLVYVSTLPLYITWSCICNAFASRRPCRAGCGPRQRTRSFSPSCIISVISEERRASGMKSRSGCQAVQTRFGYCSLE